MLRFVLASSLAAAALVAAGCGGGGSERTSAEDGCIGLLKFQNREYVAEAMGGAAPKLAGPAGPAVAPGCSDVVTGRTAVTSPAPATVQVDTTRTTLHLTRKGTLLRNFEALLHQSFPGRSVVSMATRRSGEFDFVCGGVCGPLSTRSPYWFVFRHPGRSAFHLSSRKFSSGYFGNYPAVVLIRGRTIACNRRETRFLIEYRDAAAFTLGCL